MLQTKIITEANRLQDLLSAMDPQSSSERYQQLQKGLSQQITLLERIAQLPELPGIVSTNDTQEHADKPKTTKQAVKKQPDPKPEPKPKLEPERKQPEPEPEPAKASEPEYDFAAIRALAAQLSAADGDALVQILQNFGAKRISALIPEQYPAFAASVKQALET